jgi:hypothetical protein
MSTTTITLTFVPNLTGSVSKGNKRIAKAEVVDALGNKHYITTYMADAAPAPVAVAVAPKVRKAKAEAVAPAAPSAPSVPAAINPKLAAMKLLFPSKNEAELTAIAALFA